MKTRFRRLGPLSFLVLGLFLLTACNTELDNTEEVAGETPQGAGANNPVCLQRKPAQINSTVFDSGKLKLSKSSLQSLKNPKDPFGIADLANLASSYQIKLKPGVELTGIFDQECLGTFDRKQRFIAKKLTPRASELSGIWQEVQAKPCLLGVSENKKLRASLVPDDPGFELLDHLQNIRAPLAWDKFYDELQGIGNDVVLAVLDSGVNYSHPDLQNNMWQDAGKFGYDFVNNDDDPDDDNSHGSHVSGLAAAQMNNGLGISGVMGTYLKIMAVKTLDRQGEGDVNAIINGIMFAADNGADIINMSLGAIGEPIPAIDFAVDYALQRNVTVIIAAGNDGQEISNQNPVFPGNNGVKPGVLTVAATDANNSNLSNFSNYSTDWVEIAAPGSIPGNPRQGLPSTGLRTEYFYAAGTSMATPIVSGAAGLAIGQLKSRGLAVTPTMVETLLVQAGRVEASLDNRVALGKHLDLLNLADLISGQLPPLIAQQPLAKSLVIGEALDLKVELSLRFPANFQWKKDGEDILGATSDSFTIPQIVEQDAGQYSVEIQVGDKKLLSSSAELKVFQAYCP